MAIEAASGGLVGGDEFVRVVRPFFVMQTLLTKWRKTHIVKKVLRFGKNIGLESESYADVEYKLKINQFILLDRESLQ